MNEAAIYYDDLAKLAELWPDCPDLPKLRGGPGLINAAYLAKWLKMARARPQQANPGAQGEKPKPLGSKKTKKTPRNAKAGAATDAQKVIPTEVQRLYRENRNLWGRSKQLSNSFHSAQTTAQRAKISTELRFLNEQILENRVKMKAWHQKGIIPQDAELVEGAREMSGAKLVRKLQSLRTSQSRFRAQVKQLKALRRGHPDREKIDLYIFKLDHRANQINYVESLIEKA